MGNSYEQLSAEERGAIMGMKSQGASSRAIATHLSRSPSTITRELRRNGYRRQTGPKVADQPPIAKVYDATRAGQRAQRLRYKARRKRKLDRHGPLWEQVEPYLQLRWSPEQIAGTLKSVSHETIYTASCQMPLR